jgi:hypothetical protein
MMARNYNKATVPPDVLYFLPNHTEGREEIIFTMKTAIRYSDENIYQIF